MESKEHKDLEQHKRPRTTRRCFMWRLHGSHPAEPWDTVCQMGQGVEACWRTV